MSVEELIRLLVANGWILISINGRFKEFEHATTHQTLKIAMKPI